MEHLHALVDETVRIVKLQRRPRFTQLWVILGIARLLPCDHGSSVHHKVIWVRVAAIFVIGNNDVWTKFADNLDVFLRDGVIAQQRKTALRKQFLHSLAFNRVGQSGINVAQPAVLYAQRPRSVSHFFPAHLAHLFLDSRAIHGGVNHIAALAAGTGQHQNLIAFCGIARGGCSTLR